jgi:parvulin-like peptidyl-prolyl isomerase
MKKWIRFAALLAAVTLLAGCNLVGFDAELDAQQVVAQVGDTKMTKAQWQERRDDLAEYYQYLYSTYGMNFDLDSATLESIGLEALDSMVQEEVILQKAAALGLDSFTQEELDEITADVDETMELQEWYYQMMFFPEADPESATVSEAVLAKLAEDGYTIEAMIDAKKQEKIYERIREEAIKNVEVTEEEIRADFDQKVESQKTSYDTTPTLYASALQSGTTAYYVPAGYRGIKHVLVGLDSEKKTEISTLTTTLNTNKTTRASLDEQLAELTAEPEEGVEVTDEEKAAAQESIDLINAQLAELDASDAEANEKLTALKEEAYAEIRPEAEMVLALAKGDLETAKALYAQMNPADETEEAPAATASEATASEATPDEAAAEETDKPLDVSALTAAPDFDTLIAEYGDDPGMNNEAYRETGYLLCEGLALYETAFQEAAMALENVGDVSELVEGTNGYHILVYAGDIPAGPVDYDSVKEDIHAELLSAKETEAYNAAVEAWVSEAKIKKYPKALNTPQ